MQMTKESGKREAAELVACECVVLAETKDDQNWELLSKCAEKAKGGEKKALTAACQEVEDEADEHIYHSKGWCRELDPVARNARGPAASRRRKSRENRHWRSAARRL
jgi:hypothetical protein